MLAISGHYYGTPFMFSREITQINLLSPIIFNMVVGEVIHQWSTVVAGEYTYPKEFSREVQNLAALFYTDDGLLVTP